MRVTKRPSIYSILIVLFISFALFSNYLWLKEDNSIRGDGSQNHLLFSIEFFYSLSDILQKGTASVSEKVTQVVQLLGRPVHESIYWPNGLNLTACAFYSFFGKSLFAAKLSLFPYLFILLLSTYWIGRLMVSQFVGIFASFILFMYPMIFESSRQFQLDLPLTSMVALNILFLLKCDEFKNARYSFLLGFSLGWSMLIKGQTILFTLGPLLVIGYKILKNLWNPLRTSVRQFSNIILVVIVFSSIAFIWWGHHVGDAISHLKEHIFSSWKAIEAGYSFLEKYSVANVSYHSRALFHYSMGPLLFLALALSLIFFLKREVRYKKVLVAWLLIPILLFSFVFTAKYIRFLMPVLPVTALITAWGIGQIKNKILKVSLLAMIAAFSVIQFYLVSYFPQHARNISIGSFRILGIQEGFIGADYGGNPPHKDELKIKEIAAVMRKNTLQDRPVKVGWITVAEERPSTLEMVYWLKMEDKSFYPIDLTEMSIKFFDNISSLDFILFFSPAGYHSLEWPGGTEFRGLFNARYESRISTFDESSLNQLNQLLKILEDTKQNFQLAGKIPTGNASIYYIYKRIATEAPNADY